MYIKTVELKASQENEKFILEYAAKLDVKCMETQDGDRRLFTFSDASRLKVTNAATGTAARLAVWFLKPKIIAKQLKNVEISEEIAAILGALTAYRQEEELSIAADLVRDFSIINIDSAANFIWKSLKEEWTDLGDLAARLYRQCNKKEEVYELITFLLGLESERMGTVKIEYPDSLYVDDRPFPVARIFKNNEYSLLYTALMCRPESIVIASPKKFSPEIVDLIKNLGTRPSPF